MLVLWALCFCFDLCVSVVDFVSVLAFVLVLWVFCFLFRLFVLVLWILCFCFGFCISVVGFVFLFWLLC